MRGAVINRTRRKDETKSSAALKCFSLHVSAFSRFMTELSWHGLPTCPRKDSKHVQEAHTESAQLMDRNIACVMDRNIACLGSAR